ncbi:MAG: hypothetical protein WHT63_11660, partial [Tepidiforma sp.]
MIIRRNRGQQNGVVRKVVRRTRPAVGGNGPRRAIVRRRPLVIGEGVVPPPPRRRLRPALPGRRAVAAVGGLALAAALVAGAAWLYR